MADIKSQYEAPVRVAQALGITVSSFWAGATFSISTFLVPQLLAAPVPLAVTSWAKMFNLGKKMAPPISILAAAAYGYVAYSLPNTPGYTTRDKDFWRYVAAALFSGAVGPYTIIVMSSTNNALLEKAAGVAAAGEKVVQSTSEEAGARALIDRWGVLNLIRASLLVTSAGIGAWTALL